jgi:DNA-binding NarL/FixJ family response regulator
LGAQLNASRTPRAGESLRILVVDDFPPFRESLYSLFRDHQSSTIVGEAADGEAAIEMAVRLAPHAIIMDVKMPRMGGVEATRRIKRFLPGVHVIGISTRDDTLVKETMTAAGCSHFVTKDCAHTLPDVIASITGLAITNSHHFEGPHDEKRS